MTHIRSMKEIKHIGWLLLGLFTITSCSTYSKEELKQFDTTIAKYAAKQPVKYEKSESGLYYYIENEGQGESTIRLTDEVTFAYEGRFLDGKVFDKQTAENPVTYKTKALIGGWKEVFAYLKKGGKAKIIVPPQLGYGDHELKDIPKNSILVFDLEIIDVK